MRVAAAPGTGEQRDALAQDWGRFMARALPECLWLPVPNLGDGAEAFFAGWGLDGLVLTGGNDIGESPLRDDTERRLLALALARGIPVLAVCRGLQLVQTHLGGVLARADACRHVAKRHDVLERGGGEKFEVNSYHAWCVREQDLAPGLSIGAVSGDGCVESASTPDGKVLCLQWHPEREHEVAERDRRIIRALFGHN